MRDSERERHTQREVTQKESGRERERGGEIERKRERRGWGGYKSSSIYFNRERN